METWGKKVYKSFALTRFFKPAIAPNRKSGIIIIVSIFMSFFNIFYILLAFLYIILTFSDILIKFFNRVFYTLYQRHHVDGDLMLTTLILILFHIKPTVLPLNNQVLAKVLINTILKYDYYQNYYIT